VEGFVDGDGGDFDFGVAAEDDDGEAVAARTVAMLLDRVADIFDHLAALRGGDAERLIEEIDDREAFAAALVLDVGEGEDDERHHHGA